MKRVITFASAVTIALSRVCARAAEEHPKDGLVPDAATAIKIAVAVWEPLYGASTIAQEKPYRAYLKGDVWVVVGTLPTGAIGGVAQIEITKKDGCIKSVFHSQ